MRSRLESIERVRSTVIVQLAAIENIGEQSVVVRAEDMLDVLAAFDEINTPEVEDFVVAIVREAAHQRLRWPNENDAGKADADWLWLLGWLAGKAVHATDAEKRLHHIITTAAACLNWHAARVGTYTLMRPSAEPPQ